jgi:hypothetical protein
MANLNQAASNTLYGIPQGVSSRGGQSANDEDQAAGTRRHNHWQPTLPPLACILWFVGSLFSQTVNSYVSETIPKSANRRSKYGAKTPDSNSARSDSGILVNVLL